MSSDATITDTLDRLNEALLLSGALPAETAHRIYLPLMARR